MSRRMRLPNGFGQISKISGRIRKPWRAMVTLGQDPRTAKYNRLIVGYYKTYNEAYSALIEYHKKPYEAWQDMTMEELYAKWSEEHFKTIKTAYHYKAAWKYCTSIYKEKVRDINRLTIKSVIEADMPQSMHGTVKLTLSLMFDYAIGLCIIDDNPAKLAFVTLPRNEIKHHVRFSDEELDKVFRAEGELTADMIIFGVYTGFRPGEICKIKKEDVDLEGGTIKGGSKTKAGIGRVVPIHNRITSLVERYMKEEGGYLFGVSYASYNTSFCEFMESKGLGKFHRPHDTRVTFVSRAKEAGCDEYIIKKIVGHKIDDLTERVYTQRGLDSIRLELSKVL